MAWCNPIGLPLGLHAPAPDACDWYRGGPHRRACRLWRSLQAAQAYAFAWSSQTVSWQGSWLQLNGCTADKGLSQHLC